MSKEIKELAENICKTPMVSSVDKSMFEAVEYSFSPKALNEIIAKHKIITTAEGAKNYKAVMSAIADFRAVRVAIEKERKEKKAAILQAGRDLDGKAKELQAIIEPEESRLKQLRQVEDDKAAQAEADRIAAIKARIAEFVAMDDIETLSAVTIDNTFAEFQSEAEQAVSGRIEQLIEAARIAEEERLRAEEAERIAKEREALEREKAEQEANAKAEREALERARKEQEAEAQAEREAFEAEQAKAKAEQEAAEKKRRAEQEKIDAERRKVEEEKRAVELEKERQRIAAEEKERAEREAAEQLERQATLKAAALAALPEIDRAIAYVSQLKATDVPKIKSKKATAIINTMLSEIDKAEHELTGISRLAKKAAA